MTSNMVKYKQKYKQKMNKNWGFQQKLHQPNFLSFAEGIQRGVYLV